jgi:hypothetical protein
VRVTNLSESVVPPRVILAWRGIGVRATSMEIRSPRPVVGGSVTGDRRKVVDPVAPVRHAVAILVDDDAIGDPRLRGVHVAWQRAL